MRRPRICGAILTIMIDKIPPVSDAKNCFFLMFRDNQNNLMTCDEFVQNFLNKSSPQSVSEIKKMLYNFFQIEKKLNLACEINAKSRKGSDCIKGVNRFLNKEKGLLHQLLLILLSFLSSLSCS